MGQGQGQPILNSEPCDTLDAPSPTLLQPRGSVPPHLLHAPHSLVRGDPELQPGLEPLRPWLMADSFPAPPASWVWGAGLWRSGSWCSFRLRCHSERRGPVPGAPHPAGSWKPRLNRKASIPPSHVLGFLLVFFFFWPRPMACRILVP